jgi:hypothetical protein
MKVDAHGGVAHDSVKLGLLANGNWCEVDSNMFNHVVKPYIDLKYCPASTLTFCVTRSYT